MRLRASQATEIRLGRQRAPQHEEGDHPVPYLRSANITDGSLDLRDVKSMKFTPAEQAIFGLRDGDVLVTEGSGSRSAVGASAVWRQDDDELVCFQNTLLRVRPRDGITDPRYVAWWARHAHASGQMAAVATGANILHLGSDGLKRLEMDVPSLDEQRRIADFLDGRVATINRSIVARHRQAELIAEAVRAELASLLLPHTSDRTPIRRMVCDERLGAWGSEPGELPVDAFVARVADFRRESFALGQVNTVRSFEASAVIDRSLRHGDVLLERSGGTARNPVGCPAYVDHLAGPTISSNFASRLRPIDSVSDGRYLSLILGVLYWTKAQSPYSNQTTGIQNLDSRAYLSITVPRRDFRIQVDLAAAGQGMLDDLEVQRSSLAASANALAEYKKSLITSAVTGELDVTAASGRGIPGADA